ncbi:hypothetical protein SARC_02454 [Sphaeroforma arctica JP610]|uniref:Rhodanese domain-containing protein n=1 Tax=Sphaeroforma arctica JP610 TaxID=667725 RepID=A0A0L0G8J7_9EUKA|nr:hypothetical protein SARC_02454 [Sphaeroforma arctica JP610]KNC85362.1 hypothetical protein SARC_02454 [Sphaeroforma arctica JP610]|eukprot:XP_014159264.1 hypothetical protein SARC_02454 [Sphaeroforma arctica JP610]
MKRCFETVTNNAIKNVHYKDMEMTRTAVLDTKLSITRFLVKLKKEVISMGVDEANPALAQTPAKHLEPKEFKKWLDEDRDVLILDTRNDYEVVLGTFKNAKHFDIHTFREFPQAVKESKLLKDVKAEEEKTGKKKDIVMFCTGGVRCEKAAFCFKQAGFHSENLYQLNGGILHYLQEVLPLIKDNQDNTEEQDKPASESPVEESTATDAQPTDTTGAPLEMDEEKYKQIEKETHYEGECFVFDDRVSVRGVDLKVAGSVLCGSCLHPFSKAQQQTMRAAGGDMKCPGCEVEDVLNISRPARC